MQILIVDDDQNMRRTLVNLLEENHQVVDFGDPIPVTEFLEKNYIDLVITDNQMPGMTGQELIVKGKEITPTTSFILMTAYASVNQAVEALQKGADDYIMKPFDLDDMEHRIERISKLRQFQSQNSLKSQKKKGLSRLIGKSENIKNAKEFVTKVAGVPSSILILGPTGSGKEVLSRAIHESSDRSESTFVAINCATLNDQLIESELFGHEKGAFTGAVESKAGKFELASDGTIFLDEIGELSIELQAKLLRVLQEKEFYRLGGNRTIKTNARIIAATHRNLKEMVSQGKFREDLYFRLNVLNFELKPLQQRVEDIDLLIVFFWQQLTKELGRNSTASEELMQILKSYNWPGNIRELKNILERLIVLGPQQGEVSPELLPSDISGGASYPMTQKNVKVESNSVNYDGSAPLSDYLQSIEFSIIKQAMTDNDNNQVKAGDFLQMKRGTLQYKLKRMKELGLI